MDAITDRKTLAAASDSEDLFEVTEFGRRRVSHVPKFLQFLAWVICWPFKFIYQKCHRSDPV